MHGKPTKPLAAASRSEATRRRMGLVAEIMGKPPEKVENAEEILNWQKFQIQ